MVLAPASPPGDSVATERLQHEYALRDQLDPSWAISPLRLARWDGRTVLVLGDPGGQPLDRQLGRPVALAQFLDLAISLTAALRQLHSRGLIHKDVKPANAFVDDTGVVRLTGFGFATRMPRERPTQAATSRIAGSLEYIAPEQTGRVNRSIDSRSDLYALGVTLYEILVGALPFSAARPMEWIHSHIARVPPPPSVRIEGVPAVVEAIILKLLSKNAEDRYQTAAGVEFDLRRCLSAMRAGRLEETFPLATSDRSEQLRIPERLYGRDREIAMLTGALDRVVMTGAFELLLVTGGPGIGKTSLVNELRSTVYKSHGFFASSRFENSRRHIPYATLVEVFQGLLRQLLSQSDEELTQWRVSLRNALGTNGQLFVELFPELEQIIGRPQPLLNVSPQEARNRFQFVLRRFVAALAQREHPLTLFLDDLQWIDDETRELLRALVSEGDIPYLCLIGAYRLESEEPPGAVERLLDTLGVGTRRAQEIRLTPLTSTDLCSLVSDTLHTTSLEAEPVANAVFRKTDGNPFFATEMLTSLSLEGALWRNSDTGAWQWDPQAVQFRPVSRTVAQLIAEKLVRLEEPALETIKTLSCLSDMTQPGVLSKVLDVAQGPVDSVMRDFVAIGLVHRGERSYSFAHDEVREAAYALLPENARNRTHLRLARLLSQGRSQDEIEECIFEIVHQFNRGAGLIADARERIQLAQLNLIAGKRAYAAAAHAAALGYLDAGCALLSPESWDQEYRLTFELELHRAECRFVVGDLSSAEERLSNLARRSTAISDFALIVTKQVILYGYLGMMERAIDLSVDCLERMHVSLPLHPTEEVVQAEYLRMRTMLGESPIEKLLHAPPLTNGYWREVMGILEGLLTPAGTINPDLQALVTLRMVTIALEHGVCDEAARACSNLGGLLLGWRYGTFEEGAQFGKLALQLVDRGFVRYAARIFSVVSGTIGLWTLPLRECYELGVRATDVDRSQGGIIYSGYAWSTSLSALFAAGAPLIEVDQYAEIGLAFSLKSKFSLLIECINSVRMLVRALRGMTHELATFSDVGFDEHQHERFLEATPYLWHGLVRFRIRKLQLLYLAGDYAGCLNIAARFDDSLPRFIKVIELCEFRFFAALARAATLTSLEGGAREGLLRVLKADLEQMLVWSRRCPINFTDRARLVAAEIARLQGNALEAEALYEESIRAARDSGHLQNEALAFELAARFYDTRGFTVTAEAYLRNARACYNRWGAGGKVRHLEEAYPFLRTESYRLVASGPAPVQNFDVDAMVEMYQAISGEIVFERLIERLMVTVVQYAGAVRGLLLLARSAGFHPVAEASTTREGAIVRMESLLVGRADLPQSVFNYVTHTHEVSIVGDAVRETPHSTDPYVQRTRCRSILCLPLLKQQRCVGLLYLENGLSPHVFTPDRVSVLQLVASQAAIAIENAELFANVRQTQERARRVSEELQRSFDMIPALAWRAAPDGTIEVANRRWMDYTGLSPAETCLSTWFRAFHQEDIEKVQEKWAHLLGFRTSGEFEARMRRFDGVIRSFLVRVTPTLDGDGSVVNWHGTHTDIDDLKQAQDSLRKSEAELAEGQRISHTGSWAWKSASDMVSWSEECARIFGCPEEQRHVPYSLLEERIHPEDRAHVKSERENAIANHADFSMEHRIKLPDGSIKTILHTGRRIGESRDQGLEYVGTVLDVTEHRRNENRVREVQAALSQMGRLTALGELTASIAHEVSQPLMSMMTNAATCVQWLEEDQTDIEAARKVAKRIIRDGKRAGDVINSIRALAKKTPPKMAVLDINAAIVEVLQLTKSELERHSIAWTVELAPDPTLVLGDRVQIQQVILNLVINAIDALQGVDERLRRVIVASRLENEQSVLVSISDTGLGIEPATNEKIFEAFYTTKADGLGIGLSTCRSIVEAHGGRLWAAANGQQGTVFHFTLARRIEQQASVQEHRGG